jgi:HK97 gp10 family phage protein
LLKWNGEKVKENLDKAVPWAINSIMAACIKDAKSKVPVSTSTLQGSIRMEPARKIAGIWTGAWGSYNCKYAIFVERGSSPHKTSEGQDAFIASVTEWCRHKGIENPWPIIQKIRKNGTKAQPFLRPAADQNYKNLKRKIREGMAAL